MDVTLIAVAMHSFERIAAVLLGGVAVYYGYRLFLVLPTQTRSDGKIELPGISVVLAKAGPGLFFAAFGALVILSSLFKPVEVRSGEVEYAGMVQKAPAAPRGGSEQDAARAQLALQSVNCMQRLAGARAKELAGDFELSAREAKLALLARAWDAKRWGDYAAFEQWAAGRSTATASAARTLFEAQRSDCPA
jgi:hypothetical protein